MINVDNLRRGNVAGVVICGNLSKNSAATAVSFAGGCSGARDSGLRISPIYLWTQGMIGKIGGEVCGRAGRCRRAADPFCASRGRPRRRLLGGRRMWRADVADLPVDTGKNRENWPRGVWRRGSAA